MKKSLTVIEQKEIEFQGEPVIAVLVDEDGRENVYVILRPLVESLGLAWSPQRRRIKRNIVLNEVCTSVTVTVTQRRKMLALPLSHLNGFLFGIDTNRIKPELQSLLLEYQRDCYQILFKAFNTVDSMRRFYGAVGYDPEWISARIEKHGTETDLSHVWLIRGVPVELHKQLQNEISKAAFGITTDKHRELKKITEADDLHDHMSTMELLISAIGDESTRLLAIDTDAQGLDDNIEAAKRGGSVAGKSRQAFEETTGRRLLTDKNNLDKPKKSLPNDGE